MKPTPHRARAIGMGVGYPLDRAPPIGTLRGYGFGTLFAPAGPSALRVGCAKRKWVQLGEARTVKSSARFVLGWM
jgi:hypothetical protein